MTWRISPEQSSALVATNLNLYRLLAYMPANMLESLIDLARGKVDTGLSWKVFAERYQLDTYDYIEVHYHGVLNIHENLRRICVSRTEASREPKSLAVYDWYNMEPGKTPLVYVS